MGGEGAGAKRKKALRVKNKTLVVAPTPVTGKRLLDPLASCPLAGPVPAKEHNDATTWDAGRAQGEALLRLLRRSESGRGCGGGSGNESRSASGRNHAEHAEAQQGTSSLGKPDQEKALELELEHPKEEGWETWASTFEYDAAVARGTAGSRRGKGEEKEKIITEEEKDKSLEKQKKGEKEEDKGSPLKPRPPALARLRATRELPPSPAGIVVEVRNTFINAMFLEGSEAGEFSPNLQERVIDIDRRTSYRETFGRANAGEDLMAAASSPAERTALATPAASSSSGSWPSCFSSSLTTCSEQEHHQQLADRVEECSLSGSSPLSAGKILVLEHEAASAPEPAPTAKAAASSRYDDTARWLLSAGDQYPPYPFRGSSQVLRRRFHSAPAALERDLTEATLPPPGMLFPSTPTECSSVASSPRAAAAGPTIIPIPLARTTATVDYSPTGRGGFLTTTSLTTRTCPASSSDLRASRERDPSSTTGAADETGSGRYRSSSPNNPSSLRPSAPSTETRPVRVLVPSPSRPPPPLPPSRSPSPSRHPSKKQTNHLTRLFVLAPAFLGASRTPAGTLLSKSTGGARHKGPQVVDVIDCHGHGLGLPQKTTLATAGSVRTRTSHQPEPVSALSAAGSEKEECKGTRGRL